MDRKITCLGWNLYCKYEGVRDYVSADSPPPFFVLTLKPFVVLLLFCYDNFPRVIQSEPRLKARSRVVSAWQSTRTVGKPCVVTLVCERLDSLCSMSYCERSCFFFQGHRVNGQIWDQHVSSVSYVTVGLAGCCCYLCALYFHHSRSMNRRFICQWGISSPSFCSMFYG